MVWEGVTSCGQKTPIIFISERVKVNQHVYKQIDVGGSGTSLDRGARLGVVILLSRGPGS